MAGDPKKKRQTKAFRTAEREIRTLLNEWPVIPGAPADEYDCLIPQLYVLLSSGRPRGDVEAFLADQLDHHFGIEPNVQREQELAGRLMNWAESRA